MRSKKGFMKPFPAAAIFLVLATSAAFGAVDPALLGLVMPDAQVVTGVQVDQAQTSPFGQYILSQIPANSGLEQIMTLTGFDPRRDLHELVAASAARQSGLVIGRGVFQPARISAAAILGGAIASNYRGIQILSGKNNQEGSIAFLDNTMVLAGNTDAVKAAIDRNIAGTRFSGPLAQQATMVSTNNDAWFVSAAAPGSLLQGRVPDAGLGGLSNAFQSILQTWGGVKFTSTGVNATLAALARSPQDAQALVDVGKFLASMVQVNRDKNPAAGKAATLADAATFSASGSVANVSLSLPEQQIEQLLMPDATPKARRVVVRK